MVVKSEVKLIRKQVGETYITTILAELFHPNGVEMEIALISMAPLGITEIVVEDTSKPPGSKPKGEQA